MFVVAEVSNQVNQFLRVDLFKLLCRRDVTYRIVGTIYTVCLKCTEIVLLVEFIVGTSFHLQSRILGKCCCIHLCMSDEVFHQRHGFCHVFGKATQSDAAFFRTYADIEVTCQLIKFLFELFGT